MANSDPIPLSARKSVASQVATFPTPRPKLFGEAAVAGPAAHAARGARAKGIPKLGAPFALCTVGAAQVESPPKDLAELLQPTGAWLHTVNNGANNPAHCAISHASGFDDEHEVLSVTTGTLGDKLNEAAEWLDEHDKKHHKNDDGVARVLYFPDQYVYAFGIARGDEVYAVLITQPEGKTGLKSKKEYPLKEFLMELAAARPK